MKAISERDWKVLAKLWDDAIERYYTRVMSEVDAINVRPHQTERDRFWAIYEQMRDRRKDVESTFNHNSRSNALLNIIVLRRLELITDEEFQAFSEETRAHVNGCLAP
jgi:hypothetical protein